MNSMITTDIVQQPQTILPPGSILATIFKALTVYRALQYRTLNPSGSFDNAGRFYIDEGCKCCDGLARPTRTHPYGQMIHGRSLVHVAHKLKVEDYIKIVRRAKSIYEKLGDDACVDYLASGKVRDAIMAIDVGL